MSQPAVLTGQDVGGTEGALTGLLNQILAGTSARITRASTSQCASYLFAARLPHRLPSTNTSQASRRSA